jgi:hypothetical protein
MFPDIVELTKLAYKHCQPGIINIPTNAILKSGPERVREILKTCTGEPAHHQPLPGRRRRKT